MTYNAINELIASAESSGHENFWNYDGEIFMLFYDKFQYTLCRHSRHCLYVYGNQ